MCTMESGRNQLCILVGLSFVCCFSALRTGRYNVTIEPSFPQPTTKLQLPEAKCQLLSFDEDNSTFCENNIETLLSNKINLTVDNHEKLAACSYLLDCSEEKKCGSNQHGQFCRACKANFSRVLGSIKPICQKCSNFYFFLIIPFAVIGVALVFFILKCNLTVATGQINAIIFYANVLGIYRKIQFKEFGYELKFFSIFISWLNLNLGIETCFYDGMDAYTKVWLQLVFPLYLWLLIGLLLILTKLFPPVRRFFGGNCVPTLSVTVIIMTYSKILDTIKKSLSFRWANETVGVRYPLWFEDDTVGYLSSPKHTALFVIAILIAMFYIFPLTLIGLFAPCLQASSHRKAFKWVRRIKPFLDAYQAPYNDRFQHWTGLMLVIRILICVLFASNHLEDPPMYYFLIVAIVGPMSVIVCVKQNQTVYRRRFTNTLEAFSLVNLTVLNLVSWFLITTTYTRVIPVKQYITYISIALTMIQFIMVLLYQIALMACPQVFLVRKRRRNLLEESVSSDSSSKEELEVAIISTMSSEFEQAQRDKLREPLIESSTNVITHRITPSDIY